MALRYTNRQALSCDAASCQSISADGRPYVAVTTRDRAFAERWARWPRNEAMKGEIFSGIMRKALVAVAVR